MYLILVLIQLLLFSAVKLIVINHIKSFVYIICVYYNYLCLCEFTVYTRTYIYTCVCVYTKTRTDINIIYTLFKQKPLC